MNLAKLIEGLPSPICIMCGHFSIIPISDAVVPAIFQDIPDSIKSNSIRENGYAGLVPVETFKMGAKIAQFTKGKIAILVNDWQYVRKNKEVTKGIHPVNNDRDYFYKNNHLLPPSFLAIAEQYQLRSEDFFSPPKNYSFHNNNYYFSEMNLRNRFEKKPFEFAHCSLKHGCAQEYLPFLKVVTDQGFKSLVSFIPESCQLPIEQSTGFARNEAGYDLQILNIFVNGVHPTTEEFWNNARAYKNGSLVQNTSMFT